MGFRFQRRIKLLPGVRLNISKSGISTSVGGRGLTYNSRGMVTAGIPGTGLSYRHNLNAGQGNAQGDAVTVEAIPAKVAAAAASRGTGRITAGIVCCLIGGIVPTIAWAAIPLFVSGYEARYRTRG